MKIWKVIYGDESKIFTTKRAAMTYASKVLVDFSEVTVIEIAVMEAKL